MKSLLESFSVEQCSLLENTTVWYQPGGGGNWLCYLVWCYLNDRIIPGDHVHFGQNVLGPLESSYTHHLQLVHHDTDWNKCKIILGSNQAHYNRCLMNLIKNVNPDKQNYFYHTTSITNSNFKLDIPFNLDWSLIVVNPYQFINQLNQFLPFTIKWNDATRKAFLQYLYSSYPENFRGLNYRNNKVFSQEIDRIHYSQTSDNFSYERRREMAHKIFDQNWVKWDPNSWDF